MEPEILTVSSTAPVGMFTRGTVISVDGRLCEIVEVTGKTTFRIRKVAIWKRIYWWARRQWLRCFPCDAGGEQK